MMDAAEAMQMPEMNGGDAPSGDGQRKDRRGRLLHGYLHKTSNSLCGIKGYASLIAADLMPHAKTRRWARKILAEVDMMERIYRSVQEMAFPERVEPEGSALGATLERAISVIRCRHPHLEIESDLEASGRLLLPARDLEMIVSELLQNSAEGAGGFAAGAGRVSVRTAAGQHGRVLLTIQDDGPGMSAELLAQVVTPFVTTKEGRLGIGLSRVDTVMDMYRLAWRLQSRPRYGTTVVLEVATTAESA